MGTTSPAKKRSDREMRKSLKEEMSIRPGILAADNAFGQVDCGVVGEKVLTQEGTRSDFSTSPRAMIEPFGVTGTQIR